MNDQHNGKISDETIANRKAAMEMVHEAALRGDEACAGLFELESMAQSCGLGFMATTAQDWADEEEDEDVRPY